MFRNFCLFSFSITTVFILSCSSDKKNTEHEQVELDSVAFSPVVDSSFLEQVPDVTEKIESHIFEFMDFWWTEHHGYDTPDSSIFRVDSSFERFRYSVCGDLNKKDWEWYEGLLFVKRVHYDKVTVGLEFSRKNRGEVYKELAFFSLVEDDLLSHEKLSTICLKGSTNKLSLRELSSLSLKELDYLEKEFYARLGLLFRDYKYQRYFSGLDWYTPQYEDVDDLITDVQRDNILLIQLMQKDWGKRNAIHEHLLDSLYEYGKHFKLNEELLRTYSLNDLRYLRQYFNAGHGLIFNEEYFNVYFKHKDWYLPYHSNVEVLLTEIETENILMIDLEIKNREFHRVNKLQ